MPRYELKLMDGSVAVADGRDAEDAARRYVALHRDAAVIATRSTERHGLFTGGLGRYPAQLIIEPDSPGWSRYQREMRENRARAAAYRAQRRDDQR